MKDTGTVVWRIVVTIYIVVLTANVYFQTQINAKALETNKLLFEIIKKDR